MKVNLKPKSASYRYMMKLLAKDLPAYIDKALISAVNDTAKQVRTRVSRKIRDHVNIKKSDIDKHIKLAKASEHPEAKVTLSESKRIPLKYFGAKANSRGVTYRIKKGGGRQFVPSAFGPPGGKRTGIARLGFHVYRREGKSRRPIRKLFGPSPYGVAERANIKPEVMSETQSLLNKNVLRRMNLMALRLENKA